jgi:hypothetical protein
MATDNMAGLFSTPEQYQQSRIDQQRAQAIQMAQLDPFQQGQANIQMGVNRLADVGAGALGIQDPMLQQVTSVNSVMKQVNFNDPQSMMKAAIQLQNVAPAQAAKLAADARAANEQLAKTSSEGIEAKLLQTGKYLPESVTAYVQSQGRVPLIALDKTQTVEADGRTKLINKVTGEVIKDLGLAPQRGTNVSVSTSADKSYGSELGGLVAKNDIALRDSAQAAPDILNSIAQTRSLLDSGKVYTGTGANVKLNVLAFGQALGVTGATENDIITQTQQLQQQRSKAVLNQIKSSGLGTGQGFTDKDLQFLQQASAGTITLSADTLKEQLKIEEKLAKASVNKWNARVKTLPVGVTGSMGLSTVDLPTTPLIPVNQIPTVNGMTGNPLVDKYLVKPTNGQ